MGSVRIVLLFLVLMVVFPAIAQNRPLFSQAELEPIRSALVQEKARAESFLQHDLDTMIVQLDSNYFFPYQVFDSAVYSRFERLRPGEFPVNERLRVKWNYRLSPVRTDSLLRLVNDPLNFHWGECGTPIWEGKVEFWHQGQVIARLFFACSHGQLESRPGSTLIRWGAFSDRGDSQLNQLRLWVKPE